MSRQVVSDGTRPMGRTPSDPSRSATFRLTRPRRAPVAGAAPTLLVFSLLVSSMLVAGCSTGNSGGAADRVRVNVLATTDLHGAVTYDVAQYIERERSADPNVTVVDAGDFFDSDGFGAMREYLDLRDSAPPASGSTPLEAPIVRQMTDAGYDAVVLGNHEFVSNDKPHLDEIVDQFTSGGVDVLSANTYNADGSSYVRPYVVKEVDTPQGVVRLGIIGLTVEEIGEESGESPELEDLTGYRGELVMDDLVADAKKWVGVMEETEQIDAIVAVVHSGEEPKNPKNPGNHIRELARTVPGIDAIVAGHTHAAFAQHEYKNPAGENVVVTQPGSHGEAVSTITLELAGKPGAWDVVDRKSTLERMPEDNSDENLAQLVGVIYDLDDGEEVRLSDALPFDWDVAYAVADDATNDEIYDAVGYRWTDLPQARSEGLVEMVFLNEGRVVCHVRVGKQELGMALILGEANPETPVVRIAPGQGDTFAVEYTPDPQSPAGRLITLRQE